MQRSTDRILSTHVGALQRPPELSRVMMERGENSPEARELLRAAVADVVGRQLDLGIDVVDDGEFGKTLWMWYVRDRLRDRQPGLDRSRGDVTGRSRSRGV